VSKIKPKSTKSSNLFVDDSRVGINTTNPAYTLTVLGTLNVSGSGNGEGALIVDGTGNVGIGTNVPTELLVIMGNLSINHSAGTSSTLFVDSTAGRVGIGTTAPVANLHVVGNTATTDIDARIRRSASGYSVVLQVATVLRTKPFFKLILGRIYHKEDSLSQSMEMCL